MKLQLIDEKLPVGSVRTSRCLYCNSTSYGKGCRYAPKGVHFHPNDPKKCSYCGSSNYGRGCRLNPFGDIHLHGIDYNMMFKEEVDKTLKKQFLLNEITKDITKFAAYKLGIIDSRGNKIREPKTLFEQASYSPGTRLLLKVKRYLGAKTELISSSTLLEKQGQINYSSDRFERVMKYEEKIKDIFDQLHEATDNALKDGLTIEEIEAML